MRGNNKRSQRRNQGFFLANAYFPYKWSGVYQAVDLTKYSKYLSHGFYRIELSLEYINLNLTGPITMMVDGVSTDSSTISSNNKIVIQHPRDLVLDQVGTGGNGVETAKKIINDRKGLMDKMTNRQTLVFYSRKPLDYVVCYFIVHQTGFAMFTNTSLTYTFQESMTDQNSSVEVSHQYKSVNQLTSLGEVTFKYPIEREIDAFYKKKTMPTNINDISIVSQLDISRFDRLSLCSKNWDGPISIALFVKDPKSDIDKLNQLLESPDHSHMKKNVDIHLVYKSTKDKSYPINSLRNIAIEYALTDFVYTVDIDFIVSPNAHANIVSWITIIDSYKTFYVIPAFEMDGYSMDSHEIFPKTKKELVELMKKDEVRQIHVNLAPEAHFATDYEQWKYSKKPFNSEYQNHWEPYGVFRKSSHQYDPRFAGYGWDKVSHTYQLNSLGYKFIVLPDAYMIHLSHPEGSWNKRTEDELLGIWVNWFESCIDFMFRYFPSKFNPIDMQRINFLNVDTEINRFNNIVEID
eukprot:gene8037-9885_t